jgi:hypothetical protein
VRPTWDPHLVRTLRVTGGGRPIRADDCGRGRVVYARGHVRRHPPAGRRRGR